jgi:hypothetical protein
MIIVCHPNPQIEFLNVAQILDTRYDNQIIKNAGVLTPAFSI